MSFDAFYEFLDRIGYLHPIHPAMVHMPIGLVAGAVFLSWPALRRRFDRFIPSAYHAFVLAFIFYFPTILFGLMDWSRYYASMLLFPILMKIILAGIVLVLLTTGVVLGYRRRDNLKLMLPLYTLSLACLGVLGYFGGQLVYGGAAPEGPAQYQAGQRQFGKNCTGCHAHGGNVIKPNLPLRSAPQLASFREFESYLRNPRLPNREVGPMPPFPPSKISDKQVKELYEYIVNVVANPKRD